MYGKIFKVIAFSLNRGVQWSATSESTLWSTGSIALGVAVVLGSPWPCGDRAGVLVTPVGVVVVAVEGTIPHA